MKPEILPPYPEHVLPVGREYVVVKTTYPTTYGANRGRTYTKQQFCRECDFDIYGIDGPCDNPDQPGFVRYEDALSAARTMRDENEWFTDHTYNDDDDAPFDSASMNNTDNDEEVLIQVMTKTDFGIKIQRQMEAIFGSNFNVPNE